MHPNNLDHTIPLSKISIFVRLDSADQKTKKDQKLIQIKRICNIFVYETGLRTVGIHSKIIKKSDIFSVLSSCKQSIIGFP
jgi:hypothetical protein